MTTPRKLMSSLRLPATPSMNKTPKRSIVNEADTDQLSQMTSDIQSRYELGEGEGIIGKNKGNCKPTTQIY
jgi:hypothetical protein